MKKPDIIPSYNEMKQVNGGDKYTPSDYLYFAYRHFEAGTDIENCMIELFFPSFIIIDQMVLVKTVGGDYNYQQRKLDGLSQKDAQYWANMFIVSEQFNLLDKKNCLSLARRIAKCWEIAACDAFSDIKVKTSVFCDEDDISITLRNC